MTKQQIIQALFDNKVLNVLDVFLKNKSKQFFLKEVSEGSKVSLTSCYRIVRKLVKLKIVNEVRVYHFEVYQFNEAEENGFLEDLVVEEHSYVEDFVSKIKHIPGIKQIILHGVETKDKANLLIIGNDVDSGAYKPVVADFRLNKKFNFSVLPLSPDQYTQMTDMGLYSGKKTVLFDKSQTL
jgi:Fe2+ or Zn2+ uptake regulation protein